MKETTLKRFKRYGGGGGGGGDNIKKAEKRKKKRKRKSEFVGIVQPYRQTELLGSAVSSSPLVWR